MKKIFLLSFLVLLLLVGCNNDKKNQNITITFDSGIEEIQTTINTEITLPTPEKAGFVFKGWHDDAGNVYMDKASFTKDTHLTSQWEIAKIKLTFLDIDGNVLQEISVYLGQEIKVPNAPEISGYVFNKWDYDLTNITEDTTIRPLYEESTDGLVFEKNETGYTVSRFTGDSEEVIIPAYYLGKPVNRIGEEAFLENREIRFVTLPDTLEVIEKSSFADCEYLEKINFPGALELIEEEAFLRCRSLTYLTITAETIGERSFAECSSINTIILADTVRTLKAQAFFTCSSLKDIVIPSTVTTIEKKVLSWCQQIDHIYTEEANVDRLHDMLAATDNIYPTVDQLLPHITALNSNGK